ncbi:hypothetical protein AB1L30_05350 [Bremerella sp. JC817]|uniref:hypothetical protein n=1 Tax=Bremerella sp. JC817 TaxID=3231756 RepID=UPI00345B0829
MKTITYQVRLQPLTEPDAIDELVSPQLADSPEAPFGQITEETIRQAIDQAAIDAPANSDSEEPLHDAPQSPRMAVAAKDAPASFDVRSMVDGAGERTIPLPGTNAASERDSIPLPGQPPAPRSAWNRFTPLIAAMPSAVEPALPETTSPAALRTLALPPLSSTASPGLPVPASTVSSRRHDSTVSASLAETTRLLRKLLAERTPPAPPTGLASLWEQLEHMADPDLDAAQDASRHGDSFPTGLAARR